jgi:uncharacterized protein (DUF58 family)
MPTRQGWSVLIAAGATLLAARLFGVLELYLIAAAAAVLVVAATVHVRFAPLEVVVRRGVHPARVHAGESTRVELTIRNPGRRRTPPVRVVDPIGGTPGPRVFLGPLGRGASVVASYRLPTWRRGRLRLGPLRLEATDPFGLARRSAVVAGTDDVTVFPAVTTIPALGTGGDPDPSGAAVRLNAIGSQGEEFFGLREYVQGDDLRRVHWPSTARRDGDLLVRQDERPWANRTVVVLDTRAAVHDEASFERSVSSAASVIEAAHRARHTIHLVTTDGHDSGPGEGLAHTESMMEYLALVGPGGGRAPRSLVARLGPSNSGGTLVLVLGRAGPAELATLSVLRRRFAAIVAMVHQAPVPIVASGGRVRVVDGTGTADLATAWVAAAGTARRRVGAPS